MKQPRVKTVWESFEGYGSTRISEVIEFLKKFEDKQEALVSARSNEYDGEWSLEVNYVRPYTEADAEEERKRNQRMKELRRQEFLRMKKEFES